MPGFAVDTTERDINGHTRIVNARIDIGAEEYQSSSTGVLVYDNRQSITIYPNPCMGNFVIQTDGNAEQILRVYDVNGILVLSQIIMGTTCIDASRIIAGVYITSVLSKDCIAIKRLVIIR